MAFPLPSEAVFQFGADWQYVCTFNMHHVDSRTVSGHAAIASTAKFDMPRWPATCSTLDVYACIFLFHEASLG